MGPRKEPGPRKESAGHGAEGEDADRLVVADLGPAHGLRGEVSARLSGLDPEQLLALSRLWMRRPDGRTESVRVRRVRPKKGAWILELDRSGDRTEAEALRGGQILARREDLPEPDDGEWYVADLVGLSVFTGSGEELGTLDEVLQLPANDVIVVHGARGEILLPVLDHVIVSVDAEAGRMVVEVPPGLLDEDEERERG